MSVDLSVEDVSLEMTLLSCRNAYVHGFLTLVDSYLPAGRNWRAFQEHHSAYVDYEYWGVEKQPVKWNDLYRAGDLVEEFQLFLKALRELKRGGLDQLSEYEIRVLKIFSEDQLKCMRDHCRDNPESRILVSLC